MSGQPDDPVSACLRRIGAKLDRLIDDVQHLKHRVTSLESQVAVLESAMGSIRGDVAAMSLRIDGIETLLQDVEWVGQSGRSLCRVRVSALGKVGEDCAA